MTDRQADKYQHAFLLELLHRELLYHQPTTAQHTLHCFIDSAINVVSSYSWTDVFHNRKNVQNVIVCERRLFLVCEIIITETYLEAYTKSTHPTEQTNLQPVTPIPSFLQTSLSNDTLLNPYLATAA